MSFSFFPQATSLACCVPWRIGLSEGIHILKVTPSSFCWILAKKCDLGMSICCDPCGTASMLFVWLNPDLAVGLNFSLQPFSNSACAKAPRFGERWLWLTADAVKQELCRATLQLPTKCFVTCSARHNLEHPLSLLQVEFPCDNVELAFLVVRSVSLMLFLEEIGCLYWHVGITSRTCCYCLCCCLVSLGK